ECCGIFQAGAGIRDRNGACVQTWALPICFSSANKKMVSLIVVFMLEMAKWSMLVQKQQVLNKHQQKLTTGVIDILVQKDFKNKSGYENTRSNITMMFMYKVYV